jgi:CheY-like chemotaxis protein
VHVLIAADADWVIDEVVAALGGPDTSFTVVREGHAVSGVVRDRTPDLVILDLQIGTMGGVAVAMALRLDESGGLLPRVQVLTLLDRRADVFMARRSGTDGWVLKPLDALRLRRAALAVAGGGVFHDTTGLPIGWDDPDAPGEAGEATTDDAADADPASADAEPAPAG